MSRNLQAAEYAEPSTVDVLILTSFIFILNISRGIFETLIHAGLIGEIAVGIIYGTPLAKLLHSSWETTFRDLGYIGLIIIVLEGGLQARIDILRRNLVLSVLVAVTGIAVPIGLSVCLLYVGYHYSFVDAFTGGSALAATSLGTTIALLSSGSNHQSNGSNVKDLRHTRIGSILLSAALLDDVVGLILASIIASITASEGDHAVSLVEPILRPIGASVGLFLIPTFPWSRRIISKTLHRLQVLRNSVIISKEKREIATLTEMVLVTSGFVAASHYAGASMLLGAWVAGSVLNGVDEVSGLSTEEDEATDGHSNSSLNSSGFVFIYEKYISQLQNYLLAPLFFSSIGAAIPFLSLWSGQIIWRGLIYSLLMFFGKFCVGIWTLLWPSSQSTPFLKEEDPSIALPPPPASSGMSRALYPTLFLSLAMVSRGEISLIIAQLGSMENEPYMVVMWAIVLCTIAGPALTGLVLKYKYRECSGEDWN